MPFCLYSVSSCASFRVRIVYHIYGISLDPRIDNVIRDESYEIEEAEMNPIYLSGNEAV